MTDRRRPEQGSAPDTLELPRCVEQKSGPVVRCNALQPATTVELPAIRLRGLKPEGAYQVEVRQPGNTQSPAAVQTLSGATLVERGMTLRMRGDYLSALVRITEAN